VTPSSIRRIRFIDRIGRPGWFVATGVLLGLSFPPFPFWWLALVALVPLLARWSQSPAPGMLFRETYSAFLIFAAFSGYWVLFHSDTLKALLLGVGVMLLPLLMTLPVLGSSFVRRRFGIPTGMVALVSGWLALELIFTHGPLPVPWLLLGHSLADALLVNQFADVSGVGGLTLWVWAVNLAIFGMLAMRSLTARFSLVLTTCTLLIIPVAYGAWRMTTLTASSESLRVAIVQPVLSTADWGAIASAERVQLLADMADEELDLLDATLRRSPTRPQLVIWPEGALPVFPDTRLQQTLYNRLSQWSTRRDIALLAGAVTRFDTAPALTVDPYLARQAAVSRPYYNSALLFDGGQRPQQYDKIHMVPVADQVPLVGWEPGQRFGVGHSFGIGGQRTLFQVAATRFSTTISYEVVFGNHVRNMVLDGAEFVTVLFNPSSWTFAPAHRQLESLARLRAIENRRAIVIASVTGGSGVILPDGSQLTRAEWGERSVVLADIPRGTSLTTYAAMGDVIYKAGGVLAGLFSFGFVIVLLFSTAKRKPTVRRRRSAVSRGEIGVPA
jgi:apolipoprotein N-acyltransferase